MRTILVPVDFTSTAEHAVNTAVEWAKQYGYNHIILLRTSYESMFNYITTGADYALVNEEKFNKQQEDAETLLARLRRKITERTSAIQVTTEISGMPLLRCIIELIKNNPSIELIILGSDHKIVSNDSFVSANIISIARASPVKVLIIPNSYDYGVIGNILIPCDISSITNLDRLSRYKFALKRENARLMLLNIDTKENTMGTAIKKKEWEENIRQYLGDIPYNIYYSFDKNIINGILSFTSSHKADLIIALPRKHSFLYYLAKKVSPKVSTGI